MNAGPPHEPSVRLSADTQTVEDLVDKVRRGLVRVPSFQRGLRWRSEDVVALFDSVFRGYPVGSFLLQKRAAPAARVSVGPLQIDAPATESAWWVVDGQQRLTALTAGLVRDRSFMPSPDDPYVVYFDAGEQRFLSHPRDGRIASAWVPVWELLDSSSLSEWIHSWSHGRDQPMRTAAFLAGSRIRQYRVPLYVVTTDDEALLRDIFYRVNKFGKSLEWDEVHDALFGGTGSHPSTLKELADDLEALGIGRPDEDLLLPCLLSFKGLDVTRSIGEHYRKDPDVLRNAVQEALPAIRSALIFLRAQCEIVHLRLLPRAIPLVVLTRFFALHSEPSPRTLDLLTRWVWRGLLAKPTYEERTFQRRCVAGINPDDEEDSVQQLLALLPGARPHRFVLPSSFDARAAESRIALLGMCSLRPTRLDNGQLVDVAALIHERDIDAFRKIIPGEEAVDRSPANRLLLPGAGSARRELLLAIKEHGVGFPLLQTHGISRRAAAALVDDESGAFVEERSRWIEEAVERLGKRLAQWSRSDRPSVAYLLRQAESAQ